MSRGSRTVDASLGTDGSGEREPNGISRSAAEACPGPAVRGGLEGSPPCAGQHDPGLPVRTDPEERSTRRSVPPPAIEGQERSRLLSIVLPGLFAALVQVVGTLSLQVNVEFKTLTIFLAGYLCGTVPGAFTGLLATGLHQMLNPLGPAGWPFWLAQALVWVFTGVAGDLTRRLSPGPVAWACMGASLTLIFHVVTDLAMGWMTGVGFVVYFVGGFATPPFFTPLHLVSNAVIFGVAGPTLGPSIVSLRGQILGRAVGPQRSGGC